MPVPALALVNNSNKKFTRKGKGKSKVEETQEDSLAALFARNAQIYINDDDEPQEA